MDGIELTRELRSRFASEGLNVALPLGEAAFDEVCSRVGSPRMTQLLTGGAGAIVLADGGPGFFTRFVEAESRATSAAQSRDPAAGARSEPLDDYTRVRVAAAATDVLGPRCVAFRILHPFAASPEMIPFQRLGQAAGLPEPGPLGLQVHPTFGPWWAYRALLIVAATLAAEQPTAAPCTGCPRPCVAACPVDAVTAAGFVVDRCVDHRLSKSECRESCAARLACPVGATHRYPSTQLSFHMRASLIQAALHRSRGRQDDAFP